LIWLDIIASGRPWKSSQFSSLKLIISDKKTGLEFTKLYTIILCRVLGALATLS